MTAHDDVRACPFCGHAGPFDQMPYAWLDGSGANVIRCPMCHGAAPAKTWNRRAAHADLSGEVRELVADALRHAAKVIELYDDAAANACEMATSTDCAEILNVLADQAALAKFTQEKPHA